MVLFSKTRTKMKVERKDRWGMLYLRPSMNPEHNGDELIGCQSGWADYIDSETVFTDSVVETI